MFLLVSGSMSPIPEVTRGQEDAVLDMVCWYLESISTPVWYLDSGTGHINVHKGIQHQSGSQDTTIVQISRMGEPKALASMASPSG